MSKPNLRIAAVLHLELMTIPKQSFNYLSHLSHFGVIPTVFEKSWCLINQNQPIHGVEPKHLYWVFLFLKVYCTENVHITLVKKFKFVFSTMVLAND